MYPIIKKEKLADKIYLMDVKAERVAKSAKPGQFVESSETNERTGNIEISTDSGKAVPYELSGNWVVKCVFVMPDENVTITEKGV